MSKTHQLKTQELIDLIAANGWQDKFQKAFEKAKSYDVQEMDDINSLDDYFDWLDANLTWIPVENKFGRAIAKAYPVGLFLTPSVDATFC